MQAIRHGCEAAIAALVADNTLTPGQSLDQATDILWTILSIRNWEQLTSEYGWTQEEYVERTQALAR